MAGTVARAASPDFARTEHLRPLRRMARSGYVCGSSSRPSRAARAAAAVREGSSSLRRMFVTWRWMVCSLTTSRSAICRFVRPSVTRRSTSRSRGVSSGSGAPASSRPIAPSCSRRARSASGSAPSSRSWSRAACRLLLGHVGATEGDERGRELDPCLRGLERPAASLEAIVRHPRAGAVPGRGRRAPPPAAPRRNRRRPAEPGSRRRLRSPAGPRAPRAASSSSPSAARARASTSSPAARSSWRSAGAWRRQRSASSAARAASPRSSANRARQSCAVEDGPARSSS